MRRAVAGALLALTSCGSPSGPVSVPPDSIPFQLARSPGHTGSPIGLVSHTVFLVKEDRLVAAQRRVPAAATAAETAVRALFSDLTARQRALRMTTEIPSDTRLLQVAIVDTVAEIDLSSEFQAPSDPGRILLRVAQVVYTLTRIPGVLSVRFAIDGNQVGVAADGGTSLDRPVTVQDYMSVRPTG